MTSEVKHFKWQKSGIKFITVGFLLDLETSKSPEAIKSRSCHPISHQDQPLSSYETSCISSLSLQMTGALNGVTFSNSEYLLLYLPNSTEIYFLPVSWRKLLLCLVTFPAPGKFCMLVPARGAAEI